MTEKPHVKVYGVNRAALESRLGEYGLTIDEENPAVVISYGGDGTLLAAEREWPGVPKVTLRDSVRCRTCSHDSNDTILRHLAEGTLKRTEFLKLRAEAKGQAITAFNNIILHNARITSGVRYRVWIDNEPYGEGVLVGDGLVVSTPFGSAAYYRSITQSLFRVGIGLAFNNSIEPINHLVLSEESTIRVLITRGPAVLAGDQAPDEIGLDRSDEILIRRAEHNGVILAYDRMRYPSDECLFPESKPEEDTPEQEQDAAHPCAKETR